jgi:hypothetical protein
MVSTSLGTLNPKEQSPSWKDQPSSFKISVDTANLPVEEPKPTTEPKKKGYKKPSVQPYGSIKKEKRPAA